MQRNMENLLEMQPTSIVALFQTNKEQRQSFASQVIQSVTEGNVNPLNVHLQLKAMEDIISLGFERVLTSGGYKTVDEGKDVIKSLQEKYGSQIKIMPGSGVTAQNAKSIMEYCGVDEIHSTCKTDFKEDNLIYNSNFSDSYPVSNLELIKELVDAIK